MMNDAETQPLECQATYKAYLFELAHRDRTGHYLRVDHLDETSLRQHLNVCPCCQRWYQNALRAVGRPVPEPPVPAADPHTEVVARRAVCE